MSRGKLVVIAIQEWFLSVITKQIKEILGDELEIRSVTVKDLTIDTLAPDEAVLLSNKKITQLVKSILPQGTHSFIAKRSINLLNVKKLLDIPSGKNILVVNDTKDNTEEAVKELKQSVFEHNYYPYYPDEEIPGFIDYVVTPGEAYLIPKGIANVIDIGIRVVDIETVIEIYKYFNIQYNEPVLFKRYMKSLVSLCSEDNLIKHEREHAALQGSIGPGKIKFDDFVTESKAMKELVAQAKKISESDEPVFIFGETGSGKSMLSQAIHNESKGKNGPFIRINCAARSTESLEKELFGYEKGWQHIPSLFEMAEGGSLCIEEIGEMPSELQSRLIKVLEEGTIKKFQQEEPAPIKARIIITNSIDTSKDIFNKVPAFSIKVPSLEERKEDFECLVGVCLAKCLHCSDVTITDDVMETLKKYSWDGNVRELFNVISAMVSLDEKVITEKCIPYYIKIRNEANKKFRIDDVEIDEKKIIQTLEKRGLLQVGTAILEIFEQGKQKNASYGRAVVQKLLEEKGFNITGQQLRLRLQILNELDLVIIRQGRAGTTISSKGEKFLEKVMK